MKKHRGLKIRINPERSPLNRIRKRLERPGMVFEEAEKEYEVEESTDINQFVDRILEKKQGAYDAEKNLDVQFKLLKMMYSGDVDAKSVLDGLGISREELEFIVSELVELGFLKFLEGDELVITEEGISFIKLQDSKPWE